MGALSQRPHRRGGGQASSALWFREGGRRMGRPVLTIRLATPADAAAIARIYNQGIVDRIATFETEPRSPEQIAAQLAAKGDHHPTVVVEQAGQIVAYAGAGPY